MKSNSWMIIGIPLFITIISWKVFEWFAWSRSRSYRKSRWEYYKAKISFALTTLIASFVVVLFVSSPSETTSNLASKNNNNKNEEIRSNDSADKQREKTAQIIPKTVDQNKDSGKVEKKYTDEEIIELETKAQYHGDDPIVRSRLGLPPKN